MRLQDECRYIKHIYIGSQRVVSKIGDFDSYGSDPRRIQYAGSETDGLSVDYKQKFGKRPTPYVPESWRPIIVTGYYPSVMGGGPIYEIGWPYGDNPKDSRWIIRGFNYYKSHMK